MLLWQSDGLEEKALLPQYLVHGNDGPTSQTDFFVDSLLADDPELKALRFDRALLYACGTGHYARQNYAIVFIRRTLTKMGILSA